MEPKRIALTDNSFEAGGKKYIIHSMVNVGRYIYMEELQVRAAFGQSYVDLHRGYRKYVELVNKGNRWEADKVLNNMMEGVARGLNKQQNPVLLIATLFCCPEDEDQSVWDEETANEKIKTWAEEGYPPDDFFSLSLKLCERYQSAFAGDSQGTLEEAEIG